MAEEEKKVGEKLYINCDYVEDASSAISLASSNINTNISSIIEVLNKKIKQSWVGDDCDEFIKSFKKTLVSLQKYSKEIDNIGIYLSNIASEYSTTENDYVKEMNGDG